MPPIVKVYSGDNDMSAWNSVGKARQAIDKQQSKAEHKEYQCK